VKSIPIRFSVCNAAGVLFCAVLLAPVLCAQEAPDPETGGFFKRFAVGVRESTLGLSFLSSTDTTTAPTATLSTETTRTPTGSRIGGGVTAEFAVTRRVLVSGDLLFHRFSYTTSNASTLTLDDGTTQTTTVAETTRARYWDLPVLARVKFGPPLGAARLFVGGGGSLRRVANIRTTTTTTASGSTTSASNTARTPANKMISGVVAAVGFRAVDDFGIRLTPEVRYIRWMSDLFTGWPAQQRRNELDVVVGLTF
jgi:hypothetical protein